MLEELFKLRDRVALLEKRIEALELAPLKEAKAKEEYKQCPEPD